MATAWQVVRREYIDSAFDGEGARRVGGRFNSRGNAVVYTADSVVLALLEVMVHVSSYKQLINRVAIPIIFEEQHVASLEKNDIPADWRAVPPSRSTQIIGDQWVREELSVVLRVPSVIVPHAFNYIINPHHPDFEAVDIGPAEEFTIDPRLIK